MDVTTATSDYAVVKLVTVCLSHCRDHVSVCAPPMLQQLLQGMQHHPLATTSYANLNLGEPAKYTISATNSLRHVSAYTR